MISLASATALKDAGLRWSEPGNGDCFAIPRDGLEDSVFVVSDMTIEVAHLPVGALIKFNGTTEWALDSIEAGAVVWLPSEAQLRQLLGGTFRSLRRQERDGAAQWIVETEVAEVPATHEAQAPEEAYASALLALLSAVTG